MILKIYSICINRTFGRIVVCRVHWVCLEYMWCGIGLDPPRKIFALKSHIDHVYSRSLITFLTELYNKDLHNPDNYDGMITHLGPDILQCKVRWTLGSITTNKAGGVMEFQLSYFKSWKTMLWKCCTQYVSKFGKLSSGPRTGKDRFSFQSQRKAMPKNAQTTTQLHSSHTLVK